MPGPGHAGVHKQGTSSPQGARSLLQKQIEHTASKVHGINARAEACAKGALTS